MKTCFKCKTQKPFLEFYSDKTRKGGFSTYCKACQAKYYKENRIEKLNKARTRNYGITLEEFNKKIIQQNNACDICKLPFVPHKNPCVDHNHTTGKVRSLLCTHCNAGIGHFKESIQIMQSAQEYLKKYSQ